MTRVSFAAAYSRGRPPRCGAPRAMVWRGLRAALLAAAGLAATTDAARACACCAQAGARRLSEEVIGPASVGVLAAARFAQTAFYDGPWLTSPDAPDGPPQALPFGLSAIYNAEGWALTLSDGGGGVGVIAFPATTLFTRSAVDLAPGALPGAEIAYYVEWRFRAAVAAIGGLSALDARPAELIFHGSGNDCLDGDRLTHFSLSVEPEGAGPAHRLFGPLGP